VESSKYGVESQEEFADFGGNLWFSGRAGSDEAYNFVLGGACGAPTLGVSRVFKLGV
jgi:hypothetical protein